MLSTMHIEMINHFEKRTSFLALLKALHFFGFFFTLDSGVFWDRSLHVWYSVDFHK